VDGGRALPRWPRLFAKTFGCLLVALNSVNGVAAWWYLVLAFHLTALPPCRQNYARNVEEDGEKPKSGVTA